MQIEKNKEYVVEIIDNGCEGEGIAKIDDFTIFIPGAIKGEEVKVLIVKVKTTYAFGKIIEIIKASKARVKCDCDTYKRCGGCNLRHMDYGYTLELKREIVQNLVNKSSFHNKIIVEKVIDMENPYQYRNKAQYPVGYNKNNNLIFGVYANRTHDIIPMKQCAIQKQITILIAEYIIDFMKKNNILAYKEDSKKGLIRHIVIKVGRYTNEIMCILVINGKNIPREEELVEGLTKNFKDIKTVIKNVNTKDTNVIMGQENITLYGKGYIYDELGDYRFKISPLSFYQTNPIQTEKLYNKAIELAKLQKEDIVFDLYCGIGTIGIFLAKYVKKVYGVEIVEQAIEDACENAKINKIDNIEFRSGNVEFILDNLVKKEMIKPDVVFVDPPRKGLDKSSINNIIKVQPRKIIYISCNPATLVRDLKELENRYDVKIIQPIDMFPFTSHVECVAVLQIKQDI